MLLHCFRITFLLLTTLSSSFGFLRVNMDTFRIETNKRILSSITSAIVSSTLGCAVKCTNDPICCSASYEENTMKCLLEKLCRPGKEDHVNFTTLSKITECEFEGYVYDTISHACLKLAMTTGSTWTSARTMCQQDGGDLVSLTTQMKVDFVLYLIRSTGTVWIGLRARTWMTGDSFQNFYDFAVQLNDGDYGFSQDTDTSCGSLQPNQTYPLRDDSCNMRIKNHFVCEIVLVK